MSERLEGELASLASRLDQMEKVRVLPNVVNWEVAQIRAEVQELRQIVAQLVGLVEQVAVGD